MGIPLWLTRDAPDSAPDDSATATDRAPAAVSPVTSPQAPLMTDMPNELATQETPVYALDWPALQARVEHCKACPELLANRSRTVFGVGNRQADLMLIGEAPGADEDRQGEPFVGRAGQLLNEMLRAMGFAREQVFIANVLKCRPPNNRDPHVDEAARCEPYLARQVALTAPKLIISLGRVSAHHLLKTDTPVGRLRGRILAFGEQQIPLLVTYHPAYLLRSPEQKSNVWADLQLALKTLREL
jgi:DNA polymerase